MIPSEPLDEEVVGLTLFIAGSFDPGVFVESLGLRAIRYEHARDNTVTVLHKDRVPYRFVPSRKIECDRMKFSVRGPKAIPQLFDTLLAAVEGLNPAARTVWSGLSERVADLGLHWTKCSNCGTEYDVPERIVRALGSAGIALRISVYATQAAIDRALRDRSERSDVSPGTALPDDGR